MDLALVAFWALVGWCGNEIRRWPRPRPWPGPWPWLGGLLAAVGGVAGGWLFTELWADEGRLSPEEIAATAVGALVGGIVLSRLADLAGGSGRAVAEPRTVEIDLPAEARTLNPADAQSVATVLESILGQPVSETRINEVILNGGRVRFRDLLAAGNAWTKTVWRRSGPIRPGDELTLPAELSTRLDKQR